MALLSSFKQGLQSRLRVGKFRTWEQRVAAEDGSTTHVYMFTLAVQGHDHQLPGQTEAAADATAAQTSPNRICWLPPVDHTGLCCPLAANQCHLTSCVPITLVFTKGKKKTTTKKHDTINKYPQCTVSVSVEPKCQINLCSCCFHRNIL